MSLDLVTIERSPDAASVDWQELHDLLTTAFQYMQARIDPPSSLMKMTAEDLRQKARTETLVLAQENGRIVGCLFTRDEGGGMYVGKVAIVESLRGQGLARRLFQAAFSIARENGAMFVDLETRIELTENHETFTKLGFTKISESAHAGYNRPTSITMRKELD